MSILSEASRIFTTSVGNAVYYLLLLLAIEAALGIAWGEKQRAQRDLIERLVLALAGLTLVRLAYIVVALLGSVGSVNSVTLLPPLERFADVASIVLLGWAFMPPSERGSRAWDLVSAANLIVAIGACVAFALSWSRSLSADPSLNFNDSTQAVVWGVWEIALVLLAMLAIVRNGGEGGPAFFFAMLFVMAGQILQLIMPADVRNIPAWTRLGNLVAYPLIAIGVYQNVVAGLRLHSRHLQEISQASLDQIKSLLFLFDASQQMSGSLDLTAVLDNAVHGVARALDADQCAIAFLDEANPGQMYMAAIYNPSRKGRGESVTFPVEYQLAIQQAMRRKRYLIVEESDHVQLKVLFALMGSRETGPLLVQPVVMDGDATGAIIVGNSRSHRRFAPDEVKLCQSMADQVAAAIQNARRYQAVQDQVARLKQAHDQEDTVFRQATSRIQELTDRLTAVQADMEELRQQEQTVREARDALEAKLVGRQAEMDTLTERLAVLETDLSQAHANSEAQLRWHENELARREEEWEETARATEWIQTVMQSMTAGMIIADRDGVIMQTNVAAEILLNLESEALEGLDLASIGDDDRWKRAVVTASNGEAVRLTMQVGDNMLMCEVAPLPDPEAVQGEVVGLVAILQDISPETKEQRARFEAIAAIADELRTPMTTIVSYTDFLLSETVGLLGDVQRKFVLRIKAGSERIVQMIGDLTREASGEEQWTSPRRQEVDLNRVVESAVAASAVQLEDKALTLDLDLPDSLPVLHADPDYLRRVFTNLISNACLASPAGGQIIIHAMRSERLVPDRGALDLDGDEFVIVSVKDRGGGLSDEALTRIFDRSRPSRSPAGLGESGAVMALVKTLVEAHGGRLWVESDSGVGTTFSVILPVDLSGGGNHHSGTSSNISSAMEDRADPRERVNAG